MNPNKDDWTLFLICLMVMSPLFYYLLTKPAPQEPTKFSVVDSYKNCEIIRYSPSSDARSSYLMYCGPK